MNRQDNLDREALYDRLHPGKHLKERLAALHLRPQGGCGPQIGQGRDPAGRSHAYQGRRSQ